MQIREGVAVFGNGKTIPSWMPHGNSPHVRFFWNGCKGSDPQRTKEGDDESNHATNISRHCTNEPADGAKLHGADTHVCGTLPFADFERDGFWRLRPTWNCVCSDF